MTEPKESSQPQNNSVYVVQLGLLATTVESRDEQEAIRAARRQWSLEKTQLWDLIARLEPERFHVRRAA